MFFYDIKYILFFSFFFPCGLWDLSSPTKGLIPGPEQWKCRVLTTKLPGNFPIFLFFIKWNPTTHSYTTGSFHLTCLDTSACHHICVCAQSCLTLCNPMDCSPPGSSVHGIFQAEILDWGAISYSRESSWPRVWTHVSCISCIVRRVLYH